jgi:hypothetical protein
LLIMFNGVWKNNQIFIFFVRNIYSECNVYC